MLRMGLSIIVIVVMAAAAPRQASAWGWNGHRIVGEIAWQRLSDEARAAVQDLLGEQSMAESSLWADEVKRDPKYSATSPMHYINIPMGETEVVMERDCVERGCVVQAINDYTAVARDASASREDRIDALKFIVHFIGDVHQPLHASYAEDRGGNDVQVTFFGKDYNLHGLWDYGMLDKTEIEWIDEAKALNEAITEEQVSEWVSVSAPVDWASESFTIARTNAYALPEDHALAQEYYDANLPIARERISIAGVRLAAWLNDIYKSSE